MKKKPSLLDHRLSPPIPAKTSAEMDVLISRYLIDTAISRRSKLETGSFNKELDELLMEFAPIGGPKIACSSVAKAAMARWQWDEGVLGAKKFTLFFTRMSEGAGQRQQRKKK